MLISNTPQWSRLKQLAGNKYLLRELFSQDPQRLQKMSLKVSDLEVDYSKNFITPEVLIALFDLAKQANLKTAIDSMFRGEIVNPTDQRAALHTALRTPENEVVYFNGKNIIPDVYRVLKQMAEFTRKIHDKIWLGYTGKPIKTIINIGIGGSDLGPKMAYHALRHYQHSEIEVKFVSNIDPTDLTHALTTSNPEESLFIISSKSFTTDETMTNVQTARKWLITKLGSESAVAKHFIALSTNIEGTKKFGINEENVFEFWDWVGGRYSLSSTIGLSLMLAIGEKNFREMLSGFHEIDVHYHSTPFEKNLPVILGLLNIWYANFLSCQTHAIIPYDQYLKYFPNHLQQLIMESLGKNTALDGTPVNYSTGSIIWGGAGTDIQHSFLQLLHQGTPIVPIDFIGFINSLNPLADQQEKLLANLLVQCQTLAFGAKSNNPSSNLTGNKPLTIILADKLTPKVLGELVALYEHITHVWGTVLGINCFDQPGVQYGKAAAKKIYSQLINDRSLLTLDQLFGLIIP